MNWEIIEKIRIVLGIIASIIEILSLLTKKSLGVLSLYNKMKESQNNFVQNFFISLHVWVIVSLVLLPLGWIFPNITFEGKSIHMILGVLWIGYPLVLIATSFD